MDKRRPASRKAAEQQKMLSFVHKNHSFFQVFLLNSYVTPEVHFAKNGREGGKDGFQSYFTAQYQPKEI